MNIKLSMLLKLGFISLTAFSGSAIASNCMTSPGNYYCCDPEKDICTPRVSQLKYTSQNGDYAPPGYPPEVAGGGLSFYKMNFSSAVSAVEWRRGFMQAYWNMIQSWFPDGSYDQCASVQYSGPEGDWNAPLEDIKIWTPQYQVWNTVVYLKSGGPGIPSSCSPPGPLKQPFSIMRYLVEDDCPVGETEAFSIINDSRVCKRKIPIEIAIHGASSTYSLPSLFGPISQVIELRRNGLPVKLEQVFLKLKHDNVIIQNLSGLTDSFGKYYFNYVPPFMQVLDVEMEVSCMECDEPASKSISVFNVQSDESQMCRR